MRQIGLQAARILQPGGHFVSFIDHRMLGALTPAVESADLRYNMLGVWNKQRPALGRHFRNQHELFVHFTKGTGFEPCHKRGRNVIDCPRPRKAGHPTAKPEDLIREIVELLAPAGSLIVDPFAGSGVVGAVAAATGRRAVLIDNDPANMPQLREAVPHAETIVAPSHKDRLQEFERKAAEHAAQQPDRTFAKGSLPRAARAASAAA